MPIKLPKQRPSVPFSQANPTRTFFVDELKPSPSVASQAISAQDGPTELAIKLIPGNNGEPGRRTRLALRYAHDTNCSLSVDTLRELLCTVSCCASFCQQLQLPRFGI